jgi:catechol 2,3-dioxygenase-like lactoylglutathione lyase family enzyme
MQVSHVILRVSDMGQSLAFYRDQVGLAVIAESPAFSFLDAGSIRLALNAAGEMGPDTSTTEIVFEVEPVLEVHAGMVGRGVPFAVEPRPVMEDEDRALHAAHFRDPDGHLVSITGWIDSGELPD